MAVSRSHAKAEDRPVSLRCAERSAALGLAGAFVLPAVRLGPRRQPLPHPGAALGFRLRQVVLFVRIPREVVQLFDSFTESEDVLPVVLAEPQCEVVLGDVEIRARSPPWVEEA